MKKVKSPALKVKKKKSKSIKDTLKEKTKRLFKKRKPSNSPQLTKSSSLSMSNAKTDDTLFDVEKGALDCSKQDYPIEDAINEMKEKRLTEKQENYEASKLKIKKTRRNLPKRLNGALDKPVIVLKESKLPKADQQKLNFYNYNNKTGLLEISLLVANEWLHSSQVAKGMVLIQEQFPDCNTFLRVLLILTILENHLIKNNFTVIKILLLLHLVRFLFSILTNYDCDINVCHFYESLNGSQYLNSMELILSHFAPIYPGTQFQMLYNRDVQRQIGSDDGGLFALAYIYTLYNLF